MIAALRRLRRRFAPPAMGAPHLFPGEEGLFGAVMGRGVRHYLEFGLGGSTLTALRGGARRMIAVDSDARWVSVAARQPELAAAIGDGRARLLHADIGEVGAWGRPKRGTDPQCFPRYVATAWEEWGEQPLPELAYVDGRFRVASCLSVLVMAMLRGVRAPQVLLHDLGPGRDYYRPILDFFGIAERAGTLHLLTPKPDLAAAPLFGALMRHAADAR